MSAHREEHRELAAGWVLDQLDEAERREFETHLASGCAICREEIRRLSSATALLAAAAPAVPPPPDVRDRVLSIARAEAAGAPAPGRILPLLPPRRSFAPAWAAAAAVLLVAALAGWWTSARLAGEARTLERTLAETRRELEEKRELLAVIGSPEARTAELAATPDGAAALRAHATYDPRTRSAVFVFRGLVAPAGHDFELWAVRGGAVASLGVIHTDSAGAAVLRLPVAGDSTGLDAFAVSLEKKGGSTSHTAPGGPVVLLGKLSG